jgi:hypothetical protein
MAVIFGDPLFKKSVGNIPSSRVDIFCHKGDNICGEGKIIKPAHLTYSKDAKEAAAFVVQTLQAMGGGSASAGSSAPSDSSSSGMSGMANMGGDSSD